MWLCEFFFFFRERGREGEREGKERNINVWLPLTCPQLGTGDLACNPGTYPDWESNQRPFASQACAHPLSYTSQGGFVNFIFCFLCLKSFHFLFSVQIFGWLYLLVLPHLFILVQTNYGSFFRYKSTFKLILFLCLATINELRIAIQQLKAVDRLLCTLRQGLGTVATGQI